MEDIRFFILIIIDIYWGRKNIACNKEKKYFERVAMKFLELRVGIVILLGKMKILV